MKETPCIKLSRSIEDSPVYKEPMPSSPAGRIKYLRAQKKMSGAEVARLIGMAPENYRNLENDIVHRRTTNVIRLLHVLDTTPSFLLYGVQGKTASPLKGDTIGERLFTALTTYPSIASASCALGIMESTIRSWRNGKSVALFSNVIRISEVTGIDIDAFFIAL